MNKGEFISKVHTNYPGRFSSKAQAADMLDAVLATIETALVGGEDVVFTGFGSFKRVGRAARKGRNPRTGATIDVPATASVKFTPGKVLKDAVKLK